MPNTFDAHDKPDASSCGARVRAVRARFAQANARIAFVRRGYHQDSAETNYLAALVSSLFGVEIPLLRGCQCEPLLPQIRHYLQRTVLLEHAFLDIVVFAVQLLKQSCIPIGGRFAQFILDLLVNKLKDARLTLVDSEQRTL
jgi:hypothetical protein